MALPFLQFTLAPTPVVGHFVMPFLAPQRVKRRSAIALPPDLPVLGNSLVLDLETFPELRWISAYLAELNRLQTEVDRLSQAIQAVSEAGEVYHDYWIEPYIKTKNGKQYTYHQLRWLTGERKKSGQPKVKTQHLSDIRLGEVRAAIDRGHQVEALERQRQQVEAEMARLKRLVRGTGRRLEHLTSQKGLTQAQGG